MVQTKAESSKAAPKAAAAKNSVIAHGVGRRKKSVARAWLRRGQGRIVVNGLEANVYFDTDRMRLALGMPFLACPIAYNYDMEINVGGGGKVGQADATKLAISRALIQNDEALRAALKKYKLLSVDSRIKERKKYGQKAARRKFQFVKR
jgi:small subunit ribosomal protein S9